MHLENHKWNVVSEESYNQKERHNEMMSWISSPFVQLKARVFQDGDRWCALYGDNLQDGVCGFGTSPNKAMIDFDKNWRKELSGNPKNNALAELKDILEAIVANTSDSTMRLAESGLDIVELLEKETA